MSKTRCVMPHISLAIQNYGDVCVCNVNKQSLQVDGQAYSVAQQPISVAWASDTRQDIATALDSGRRHESCRACWDAEDAGKKSVRQTMNDRFGHLMPDRDQPRIMIVKPGNTCNAACRMCNPATSSSWYRDDFRRQQEKRPDLDFRIYAKDFESVRESFNPGNPNFWPVVDQWYEKLEFLDIYGGEPWLIQGLWNSLDRAISTGHSKHIDINISTNASIFRQDYLDILDQFRSVQINFSFDSHDKSQFEYIRHKLDFDQCRTNVKKMLTFVRSRQHWSASINCSPSVLNIGDLYEIFQGLTTMFGILVSIDNFVTGPDEYYDPRHLPKPIKETLIKSWQDKHVMKIAGAFMSQSIPGCEIYWPKFCMETDRLDRIRNQSFVKAMPAWWATLEPYWDYTRRHPEWF